MFFHLLLGRIHRYANTNTLHVTFNEWETNMTTMHDLENLIMFFGRFVCAADLQDVPQHTNDVSKIPWSDQETLNLIDIWGKDSIQRSLKDCVHNRHIFNVISKKMLERGYLRTAEQCHTRIKRLKMSFKQCYENK